MLRRATVRDVVDYLEYDIDPDVWIDRLLRQIAAGTYEPRVPLRFTLAKSKGFSRRMTMPAVPDLVLYRAIADFALRKLRRREHKHVYFARSRLDEATRSGVDEADRDQSLPKGLWGEILREVIDYETASGRRFRAWLHYRQYRRYLIFKRVYPYIVTTDITNFFDSVRHDRLADCFHSVSLPPRMIGLLFFILERLAIREPYSASRRIGLPVDEFDCSRQLAHLILFSHDDRIVKQCGEDAYVRWMDDQSIGVSTKAEGLSALALVGESLAHLNLTANAGKSKILKISQAKREFHLDVNDALDPLERLPVQTSRNRQALRRSLTTEWRLAKGYENQGQWEKVLKRFYRLAGLARSRMFRRSALHDLLAHPQLAARIAAYLRATGTTDEYLLFARRAWEHSEQVYGDVNLVLVEGLLPLEPVGTQRAAIRAIASEMLARKWNYPGATLCAAVAPLLILRYGDRRSLPLLRRCFESDAEELHPTIVRACAVVYASYGLDEFRIVRKTAARFFANPLAETVQLIERIRAYEDVPGSYKHRIRVNIDSVAGRVFLDMRGMLAARLLALNTRRKVRSWLRQKRQELQKRALSEYDRDLLDRTLRS